MNDAVSIAVKSLCTILRQDRNNTSHRKPWRPCSLAYASGYQTRSFREVAARRVSEGARRASEDYRRIAHGDSAGNLLHLPPEGAGVEILRLGTKSGSSINAPRTTLV